jgi:hypothetical protein
LYQILPYQYTVTRSEILILVIARISYLQVLQILVTCMQEDITGDCTLRRIMICAPYQILENDKIMKV